MPLSITKRRSCKGALTISGTLRRPDGTSLRIQRRASTNDIALAEAEALKFEEEILKRWYGIQKIHPGGFVHSYKLPQSDVILDWSAIFGLGSNQPPETLAGLYFLFDSYTLQYIGESANAICRVATHRQESRIPFDSWRFIAVEGDRKAVEGAYLRRYWPPYNIVIPRVNYPRQNGTAVIEEPAP